MFHDFIISARRQASLYRYRLIQPAHLLHAITATEKGRDVISLDGYDIHVMRAALIRQFRHHSAGVRETSSRIEPSDIFEKCLDPVLYSPEGELDDNLRILFGAIVFHSDDDACVKQALEESNMKRISPPHFEDEEELLPDLDHLLEENARETSDKMFKEPAGEDAPARHNGGPPSGMKSMFHDSAAAVSPGKQETRAKLSKEMEEARAAMEAAQRNLTSMASDGTLDPVVGRDEEIAHMVSILMRRRKPNIILVAEPGVGKSALVEGLAMQLQSGNCPDSDLSTRHVVEVSLTAMVAGSRYRGDFEARMSMLIDRASRDRSILFIDEIHTLMGSGSVGQKGMDGANILKPALARDGLSLIGATTPEEAVLLKEDKALMRRFEIIHISEPRRPQMEMILAGAATSFLMKHGVSISEKTSGRLLDFGERYLSRRRNPDRSFDLLDLAAVSARLRESKVIEDEDLRYGVRRLGGTLPIRRQRPVFGEEFQDHMRRSVAGQRKALSTLFSVLAEASEGNTNPEPIILNGVRGMGKKHAAEVIASHLGKTLQCISPSVRDADFRLVLSEILLRSETDAEAVIFIDLQEASQLDQLRSAIRQKLLVQAGTGAVLSKHPLVFIGCERTPVRSIGFGSSENSAGDDDRIVDFQQPEGSDLEDLIDHAVGMAMTIMRDAGGDVPDAERLRATCQVAVAGGKKTYSQILKTLLEGGGL